MTVKVPGLFSLICVLAIAASTARAQTSKAHPPDDASGSMSEPEKALLNEINQARANPQLYASYLEKMRPLFNGKEYSAADHVPLMTEEGWSAVDDAIKFMRAAKPMVALNPSRGLSLAALAHVKDQSGSGMIGHQGAGKTMIEDRVKPFGNWEGGIGENISYGNDSARERLLTWLIDDGVPSRGHRTRLMSSDYKVVGISCGSHPQFSAMCVLTLAGGFIDVPSGVNAASKPVASESKPKAPTTKSRKM